MKVFCLFMFLAGVVRADSVQTTDNVMRYGRIDRLTTSDLTLTARISAKGHIVLKTTTIPRNQIVKIEFNSTTFDSGYDGVIAAHPPEGSSPPIVKIAHDYALLSDGHRKDCPDPLIDELRQTHCGKQVLANGVVTRIVFAAR